MNPDGLMIFAAGFGTRMGTLTRTTPKPMLTVGGRPMIDHIVTFARAAGIHPILANTHHLPAPLEAHLETLDVKSIREETILETGGGLKAVAGHFATDAVYTANADVIWDGPNPFEVIRNAWHPGVDAMLLCVALENAMGRTKGDFALLDGQISRGGPAVYGGIQIIRPSVVTRVEDTMFSLNVVWDRLIAENRIAAVLYPGRWCDVGTPEGLDRANALVARV